MSLALSAGYAQAAAASANDPAGTINFGWLVGGVLKVTREGSRDASPSIVLLDDIMGEPMVARIGIAC